MIIILVTVIKNYLSKIMSGRKTRMSLSPPKMNHLLKNNNRSQNNNSSSSIFIPLLIISILSLATLTSLFAFAVTDQAPDTKGPFGLLDNEIVVAVLSTVIVSLITYLLGRLRNVSQSLKEIPNLQNSDIELKKGIKVLEEQQNKNTELIKQQLEKMDSKMDRRFDNVSEKQSIIERDMNEKIVHLLMSLRNYSDGGGGNINNSNNDRYNNPLNTNNNRKYKE